MKGGANVMNYYLLFQKQSQTQQIKKELEHMKNTSTSFDTVSELKEKLDMEPNQKSIILLGQSPLYDIYEVCQEITHLYPFTAVVLVLERDKMDLKKAMLSGAINVMDMENHDEFGEAITQAEKTIQIKTKRVLHEEEKSAKVITVCSTKGGVGKTTLSVNIAVALSKSNLRVAVIDLDLQFGDVALLFDTKPQKAIYEWIKETEDGHGQSIEGYLTTHKTGIKLLSSPHLPELAELVTGEHVLAIIQEMKKMVDVIIIDTPPAFVETSLVALENSDEILLITSLDLPAVKNGKLALDTLGILGLKDKIKIVLNRDTKAGEMTAGMVEDVLGMDIGYRIPSDYKIVISSINKGEPFVLMVPRTPVSKSILKLAAKLLHSNIEKEVVPQKKKKFLALRVRGNK